MGFGYTIKTNKKRIYRDTEITFSRIQYMTQSTGEMDMPYISNLKRYDQNDNKQRDKQAYSNENLFLELRERK